MSAVAFKTVRVPQPKGKFTDPFQLEISFECTKALADDLEFKLTYVGSAESDKYDQLLETVYVGPVGLGLNAFVLNAPAPDPARIPTSDLLGVTVILLSGYYLGNEFVRIGYYVLNEVPPPPGTTVPSATTTTTSSASEQPPPAPVPTAEATTAPAVVTVAPKIEDIERSIMSDQPRITLFPIDWDKQPTTEALAPEAPAPAPAPAPVATSL